MLEKAGWAVLAIVGLVYLGVLIVAFIVTFPVGLIGMLALGGFLLIFVHVLRERLANKEDDYYVRRVHR
jgi:F0F1-type ATP synthase assembly protein I